MTSPRAPSRRAPNALTAVARSGRRFESVVRRIQPGDIAVIAKQNLTRSEAEALVVAGTRAVVNARSSFAGTVRTMGALVLARAGIALIDDVGDEAIARIGDGETVSIIGHHVFAGDVRVASGSRPSETELVKRLEKVDAEVGDELETFAADALEFFRDQRDLLVDGVGLDGMRELFNGRHVVLVVEGPTADEELAVLRSSGYFRELDPVVVGVERGADLAIEAGLDPDVVIGPLDRVSDRALSKASSIVVHEMAGIDAGGRARAEALGLTHRRTVVRAAAVDVAMLLAFESDAELIVEVGAASAVVGATADTRMAPSSFVTRMRVGSILVDATGVSRLYRTQVRSRDLLILVAAALVTIAVIAIVSEPIRLYIRGFWLTLQ